MSRLARTSLVAAIAALALAAGCSDDDGDAGDADSVSSAASSGTIEQPDGSGATEPSGTTASSPGQPQPDESAPGSAAAASTPAEVPVSVAVQPGTAGDGFEGALSDVDDQRCERDGERWVASGTVTNPLDVAASYRIYVAFLDPANETLGLVQVDATDLAPEATQDWDTALALDHADLRCVLRVERVAAG